MLESCQEISSEAPSRRSKWVDPWNETERMKNSARFYTHNELFLGKFVRFHRGGTPGGTSIRGHQQSQVGRRTPLDPFNWRVHRCPMEKEEHKDRLLMVWAARPRGNGTYCRTLAWPLYFLSRWFWWGRVKTFLWTSRQASSAKEQPKIETGSWETVTVRGVTVSGSRCETNWIGKESVG